MFASVIRIALVFVLSFILVGQLHARELIRCGVAKGYPPYQYKENGWAGGFDTDVLRLLASEMAMDLGLSADHWDNVFGFLRVGQIDCVAGMENNEVRKKYVLFTRPYYRRYSAMFVREDRIDLQSIEDLKGSVITGDRHSYLEEYLLAQSDKAHFRILQTDTKEESIRLLKEGGLVNGSIMPAAVGYYLAAKLGVRVRMLDIIDPGTPVAFAVSKERPSLRDKMEAALESLIEKGDVARLYSERFGRPLLSESLKAE